MDIAEDIEVSTAVSQILEYCPDVVGDEVIVGPCESEYFGSEVAETIDPNEILEDDQATDELTKRCPCCLKDYSKTFNLKRHMVRVHGMNYVDLNNYKGHIKCGFDEECTASFSRLVFYRQHLVLVHGIKLEKITINFKSIDEFLAWKVIEEQESQCRFNKFKREVVLKQMDNYRKRSYMCCRSGKHYFKGTRQKKKSMKIGTYCPAKMDLIYNEEKIVLTYYKTHVGHGGMEEIYSTTEQRRTKEALRRQKKQYDVLKIEVKEKTEQFLIGLRDDRFSVEQLKLMIKELDTVFDPDRKITSSLERSLQIIDPNNIVIENITVECRSDYENIDNVNLLNENGLSEEDLTAATPIETYESVMGDNSTHLIPPNTSRKPNPVRQTPLQISPFHSAQRPPVLSENQLVIVDSNNIAQPISLGEAMQLSSVEKCDDSFKNQLYVIGPMNTLKPVRIAENLLPATNNCSPRVVLIPEGRCARFPNSPSMSLILPIDKAIHSSKAPPKIAMKPVTEKPSSPQPESTVKCVLLPTAEAAPSPQPQSKSGLVSANEITTLPEAVPKNKAIPVSSSANLPSVQSKALPELAPKLDSQQVMTPQSKPLPIPSNNPPCLSPGPKTLNPIVVYATKVESPLKQAVNAAALFNNDTVVLQSHDYVGATSLPLNNSSGDFQINIADVSLESSNSVSESVFSKSDSDLLFQTDSDIFANNPLSNDQEFDGHASFISSEESSSFSTDPVSSIKIIEVKSAEKRKNPEEGCLTAKTSKRKMASSVENCVDNPLTSQKAVSPSNKTPLKNDQFVSLLKNNKNIMDALHHAKEVGRIVAFKPNQTTQDSSSIVNQSDSTSVHQFQPISEEKKHLLDSIWNSYRGGVRHRRNKPS